jgi:hypothetical protein
MCERQPLPIIEDVTPTAFVKWILKQKNPLARRIIPYVFSMANNKDLRSIDSGNFYHKFKIIY